MLAGIVYSIISPITGKQKAPRSWGACISTRSGRPRKVRNHIPYNLLTLPLSTLDSPTGFQKNIADGYFIYHDASGYHIRVTTTKAGDIVDYKGTILADGGRFSSAALYRPERDDYSC